MTLSVKNSQWFNHIYVIYSQSNCNICAQLIHGLNFRSYLSLEAICEYCNPQILILVLQWTSNQHSPCPIVAFAATVGPNTTDTSLLLSWSFGYPGLKRPTMLICSYIPLTHTNHKPLVLILGSKSLDALPVRVKRFCMRSIRLQYSIAHIPGKNLATADALSRTPTATGGHSDDVFQQEVDSYVCLVMKHLPIAEPHLRQIAQLQEEDEVCKQLKQYCLNGWPPRLHGP